MNPKISVIMPVYNVEKYLSRAIESILKQSFTDFEFLIVDDGSPDCCGRICDEYASRDTRIKVIHKENGGAPSARNVAMEQARGQYLYFLDSDDWAEPEMLGDLYALAEKTGSEMVVAGYYIDTYYEENKYITLDVVEPDRVYPTKEDFRREAYRLFDHNMLYTPWNKLYLADFIRKHQITFPNTFWDDFPFNLMVVAQVERVVVTSKQYYHFIRARAESETAAYRKQMYEKREEEHQWMLRLYRDWQIDDPASMEMIARRHAERMVGCVENWMNKSCDLSYRQKRECVRRMVNDENARRSLSLAKPRSIKMRLLLLPLKWKNITLTLWSGSVISFVKAHFTRTFALLKAKR